MSPCISIRGSVRWSLGPSLSPLVGRSVRPSVHDIFEFRFLHYSSVFAQLSATVLPCIRPCFTAPAQPSATVLPCIRPCSIPSFSLPFSEKTRKCEDAMLVQFPCGPNLPLGKLGAPRCPPEADGWWGDPFDCRVYHKCR